MYKYKRALLSVGVMLSATNASADPARLIMGAVRYVLNNQAIRRTVVDNLKKHPTARKVIAYGSTAGAGYEIGVLHERHGNEALPAIADKALDVVDLINRSQ